MSGQVSTKVLSDSEIAVTINDESLHEYLWTGTRVFYIPDSRSGHVRYETKNHGPGTLGLHVCDRLEGSGNTLASSPGREFHLLIRRELRKALRDAHR